MNDVQRGKRWALALLAIPLIATLWPPFYAKSDPLLSGIPFFYWYQFLWVILTVVITAVVYAIVTE
ncbi:MAG: hypothetical protein NVS2B16_34760 [Chloroflexota bacterium]